MVYKYRGGDDATFIRDLDSLEKDIFWAPTKNTLNDPCEGLIASDILLNQIDAVTNLIATNNDNIGKAAESLKSSLRVVLEKKDTSGVYSLSRSSTDELLWAHYANSHHGFCIEYDLDILMSFERRDYFSFDVKYSDHPPKLSIIDMSKLDDRSAFIQKLIGFKSKKWEYEKELRIITSTSGVQSYDFRAVKGIHFGLRMSDDKKQEIMRRLQGRGIKYYQVILKSGSYKFSSISVEDKYPTNKKYLYSVSPIAEYAVMPSTVSEKWKNYAPYLSKMAEIVRREPYCKEVQVVEVSNDKSKPGSPVFFGQYQRSINRWENIYLTPNEIDERYAQIEDLEA
jgi:hypothetical protein